MHHRLLVAGEDVGEVGPATGLTGGQLLLEQGLADADEPAAHAVGALVHLDAVHLVPHAGVDLTALNLARPVVDGEQILVGVAPPAGVAGTIDAPVPGGEALVNLNTADQAGLETLPGVGPVTAESIIAWRTDNGGFTSVDELLEVDGIGEATLEDLAPLVTL